MLSKKMAVIVALVVALHCVAEAREANPDLLAEALKRLEARCMQADRPRIDRRDVTDGERLNPCSLDRKMKLLKLLVIDHYYSNLSLPRFGKRSVYANWERDVEERNKPDLPTWLA